MKALFFAGAIATAVAGVWTEGAPDRGPRSIVVRAQVPFGVGETRGSASYGAEGWRVVVGWRSEKGWTAVAVGGAARASPQP